MKNLDQILYEYLRSDEFRLLVESDCNFVSPVTMSYAIERLIILHCKLYHLEDAVRNPILSNEQVGILKRKIDQLNGISRPMIIEGLGQILAKAVKTQNLDIIREESTKKYGDI